MDAKEIKAVSWTQVEHYRKSGYLVLEDGDAAKANSDSFIVMVRKGEDGKRKDFMVLCPTFLRGPLGFSTNSGVSY